ncbi:hypothetical protein FOXG_15909 [Fusarium oxysporum f. sp. lycopersici 4287]|uniref:Uncharacterized protein n=2 Tax=Fusarium oxysporum TaxID=5507 RepID=A0A0J9W781_FUSO4|nr:hypothetical protein FOXG_15909 [Fusarium oxysporum f. sp. lycopersici 4287]KNB18496.1 hypothetical protein FOXG_15909 [Fusarium oxysporum f. sp. lycopersici 4287]
MFMMSNVATLASEIGKDAFVLILIGSTLGIQAVAFNGKYSAKYKRYVITAFEKRSLEDYIKLLYITPEIL